MIAFVLSFGLIGCGALVSNTDKPVGPYVAAQPVSEEGVNVKVSVAPPKNGGVSISGISCKNRIWDPNPTDEIAIAVLKREVQRAGYNSVYISSVANDEAALGKNCWSAITAQGTAFNS
jgi:hypothetical protein